MKRAAVKLVDLRYRGSWFSGRIQDRLRRRERNIEADVSRVVFLICLGAFPPLHTTPFKVLSRVEKIDVATSNRLAGTIHLLHPECLDPLAISDTQPVR